MYIFALLGLIFTFTPPVATVQANVIDTLGLPKGTITMPGDTNLLQGGCGGDPFQALAKYGCTRQNECVPASANGQGGINSGLACRLTKLFDAAVKAGCTPKIISAYRSAAKQQSMCGAGKSGCAAAGKSCHQYGLAVDVGSCQDWLRKNSPQFQLHFPYYGPHIQCIEHRVAACNPSTPPCKGGGPISDPGQGGQQGGGQDGGQGGQQGQGGGSPAGGGEQGSGGSPAGGGAGEQPSPQQQPQNQQPQVPPTADTPVDATEGEATLTCSPEKVVSGEKGTLEWQCPDGATTVKGGTSNVASLFNPKNSVTGTFSVTPNKTTTYSLTCLKGGRVLAKASCEMIVTVPKNIITARLTATPKSVNEGESVDISWTSQNARSCSVTGPGIASADKTGRSTSDYLFESAKFTLTCKPFKSTDPTVTKVVTVDVVTVGGENDQAATQTSNTQETEFVDPLK